MVVYLWWPYPTPFGFDALAALTPAFGRLNSIATAGAVPHPEVGIILRIDQSVVDADGSEVTIDVTNTTVDLGAGDSVYIVGHCSAGVTSLVGEYASVPVALGYNEMAPGALNNCTDFAIPADMELEEFKTRLRKYCSRFLNVVGGRKLFPHQVLDADDEAPHGRLRVYAPTRIEQTHTSIADGIVTLPNAKRQHVAHQHRDAFTGEDKARRDFEKSANALAYLFRGKFNAGANAAEVILWACYSADRGDDRSCLAKRFAEEVVQNAGPANLQVFGCTGKASASAKQVGGEGDPLLRVKDGVNAWQAAVKFGNLARVYA